jgi:hypothetical protein
MKIFFGVLLSFVFFSCERISNPAESTENQAFHLRQETLPNVDSIIAIRNHTLINIGVVKVKLQDSSEIYINVPDSGSYYAPISARSVQWTINYQNLSPSVPAWILLETHIWIHASWNENVVVIDGSEQG